MILPHAPRLCTPDEGALTSQASVLDSQTKFPSLSPNLGSSESPDSVLCQCHSLLTVSPPDFSDGGSPPALSGRAHPSGDVVVEDYIAGEGSRKSRSSVSR